MTHRLQCHCGRVSGTLHHPGAAARAVCYCVDCRAHAFHLGAQDRVVDAMGGTDIVAVHARELVIDEGRDQLACLSLSPNGLLRWYARCCNTPIANLPRNWKLPYVGIVAAALAKPLTPSLPDVQARINTKTAKGTPPPTGLSQYTALLGLMPKLLLSRFTGSYRQTPFFDADGKPRVAVGVLTKAQRETAARAARDFSAGTADHQRDT